MMSIRHTSLCALFFATSVASAAPPASVNPELAPVEVTAAAVHFDVHTACPAIDQQLQHLLSRAWSREQRAASMRVDFKVEGGHVTTVALHGAPWEYRRDVRSAVSRLDCIESSTVAQGYAFQLVFINADDGGSGDGHYALIGE